MKLRKARGISCVETETRAHQEVLALVSAVLGKLVDLAQDRGEGLGQSLALLHRVGVVAEAAERLGREASGLFDQVLDLVDALVGGGDRTDGLADTVLEAAQVGRTLREALGGEELARSIERRVDLVAGRESKLRRGKLRGRLLQEKKVRADAGVELDVAVGHWSYSISTRAAPGPSGTPRHLTAAESQAQGTDRKN